MIVRNYTPQDNNEVYTLFTNTILKINRNDYTYEQCKCWINKVTKESLNERLLNSYSIVVVYDSHIVGYGNIQGNHLDHLYVHYQFQNQGIAGLICNYLEKHCDSDIMVDVSVTAKSFFEKRGYTILCKQENNIENQVLINYRMIKNRT